MGLRDLGLTKESMREFEAALRKKGQEVKGAATKGLGNAAIMLEAKVAERVAENSTDTGQYLQSIGHDIRPLESEVYASAAHAPYVEFGTRAHRPPFQPIYDWVWRKRKDFDISDREVFGVAEAICRKIAKDGTKPKHDWIDSIDEMEKVFVDIVMSEVRKVME